MFKLICRTGWAGTVVPAESLPSLRGIEPSGDPFLGPTSSLRASEK